MKRVRKGDTVAVVTGKDRGKQGKVLQIFPKRQAALVEQINLQTHYERRAGNDQPGGLIRREGQIGLEKLSLVCARCKRPTRVGFRVSGAEKQRVCRRCGESLSV